MRQFGLLLLILFGIQVAHAQEYSENVRNVMEILRLDPDSCALEFIDETPLPGSNEEVIILIPEYIHRDDELGHFDLRAHVIVYHKPHRKIIRTMLESEEWYSDAMRLDNVQIDTAPYNLGKGKRAFGIRVHHHGSSRANPYNTESLTLLVPEEKTLNIVLLEFQTQMYFGELSGSCASEERTEKSILIMTEDESKEYADIRVKTTIGFSLSYVDPMNECAEESCEFTYERVLKNDEGMYDFTTYNR